MVNYTQMTTKSLFPASSDIWLEALVAYNSKIKFAL